MKKIYEASNSVEAHIVLNMLRNAGLACCIEGEYLEGAAGRLPVQGLVRVMVAAKDFEQAAHLVKEYESTPVEPTESVSEKSARWGWGGIFLAGLVFGVAVTVFFYRVPVSTEGVDHNHDGVLDETWIYSANGTILRSEFDRNFDGKVDYVVAYSGKGVTESSKEDNDFNGTFETVGKYVDGNLSAIEIDEDGDSFHEIRTNYVNGVSTSTEYLIPTTGLPVKVMHFTVYPIKPYAELDTNQDGKLDLKVIYSDRMEEISREPIKN